MAKLPLKPRQALFVAEYVKDLNATQAAIRAGYSAKTAGAMGVENLQKPHIAEAIAALVRPVLQSVEREAVATAAEVVGAWSGVVRADARELIEHHRGACRYCYGVGHRYQRTPAEREQAEGEHALMLMKLPDKKWATAPKFDELGGLGYDPRKEPHPDCPECAGFGVGRVIMADTRNLSPEAAQLYAGVKVTREGLELKTHDKATALAALAKFHKIAGHAPSDETPAGGVHLHLHAHLVKLMGDAPKEARDALRPLLARLASGDEGDEDAGRNG